MDGPGGVASSVAGILALCVFVAPEGRRGTQAMMPLGLFGSRGFVGLTLLTSLLYGALGALLILTPFAIMRIGAAALSAGAALLPTTVILAVLSPLLGTAAGRVGARPLLAGGSAVVACRLLMVLRVDDGSSYWTDLFPALCVVGLGLAGAVAPLTTAVLASVQPTLTGTASGFNSAIARTGGSVVTACLGRVLAADREALISACHLTAAVVAAASAAAAACALAVGGTSPRSG